MAKQRYVNTRFWDDDFVIDLDPIEKLLFLYLLTNPLTEIAGAYEITLKRIAFDTGIDKDMVQKILKRFEDADKAVYRDGWLVVKNFIKHQSLNPKIIAGIRKELSKMPQHIACLIETDLTPSETPKRKKLSTSTRQRILARDGNKCVWCAATEHLEIDHINPVVLGGDDSDENLRVLCQPCNGKRNAELRWNSSGEVERKESLPNKMGGLSHLNTNTNTNTNLNTKDGAAVAAESVFLVQITEGVKKLLGLKKLPSSEERNWHSRAEIAHENGFTAAEFLECFSLLRQQAWRSGPVTPDNVNRNLPNLAKLRAEHQQQQRTNPTALPTMAEKLADDAANRKHMVAPPPRSMEVAV